MFNPDGKPRVSAQAEGGQPRTLRKVSRCEFFAVDYTDNEGRGHVDIVARVGGQLWFIAPNGEQWAGGLRPANKWLADALSERVEAEHARLSPEAPKADEVDLFNGGE